MREIFNKIIAKYLKLRYKKIDRFIKYPHEAQEAIFNDLISNARFTKWGKKYNYNQINSYNDFKKNVPISTYDDLKPYIHRMMMGEQNVLWNDEINLFSKSSGTTEDKSKFIPVSIDNLKSCHIKGAWDAVSILYKHNPDSKLFASKNLVMGGSLNFFEDNPNMKIGDISALMMDNMPSIGKPFHTPDMEIAMMADWNKKIPQMAEAISKENVAIFGGVPSWLLVLFREVLRQTGKSNLNEVWPNLEAFMHGGVNFAPYKKQFEALIPKKDFLYVNVYNSSEGYFAIQNEFESGNDDMLLLLDNQIFYEFIPFEQYGTENPDVVSLKEVVVDKNYVLLINTNSGLWRYVVGDTIKFTSINPFKIKITGRTKHYINVFGEEVMVSNTDKALSIVQDKHNVSIEEYTVGPIFMGDKSKGGHQWIIEFVSPPKNLKEFQKDLDITLQSINSDYEAKRYNSLALQELIIIAAPKRTFYNWMKSKGKLGGQNKVPRLSNSRKYVDELIDFMKYYESND